MRDRPETPAQRRHRQEMETLECLAEAAQAQVSLGGLTRMVRWTERQARVREAVERARGAGLVRWTEHGRYELTPAGARAVTEYRGRVAS